MITLLLCALILRWWKVNWVIPQVEGPLVWYMFVDVGYTFDKIYFIAFRLNIPSFVCDLIY